ncbi:ABC transporter ATP-binding protein [Streptomyces sp. NPDC004610]|uniref:ABC transporter ATP-binding protein n=1 Tax=unclassified Streptomyces TaxID=2593676 RepID=UPI0033AB6624
MATLTTAPSTPTAAAVGLELRGLGKIYDGGVPAVTGLTLSLPPGRLLALLGPSGCGKTTTLRMIAGLERPTSGAIRVGEETVADGSRWVEPEDRGLGMVFQSYALWPHMTVFENVAYALRRRRVGKAAIAERVPEVLAIVGMTGYGSRPVAHLSGGQQQRVAVARALAARPRLLLFDEPLSNLDAVLRESMRVEIRALQQENGITAVYVTHSQEEALSMADVVAVMDQGRLQQLAPPEELYARPRNRFVAGFVGLTNLLEVTVRHVDGDTAAVCLADGTAATAVAPRGHRAGDRATVALRPEHLTLRPAGTGPHEGELELTGELVSSMFSGNIIDYFVRVPGLPDLVRVQDFPPRAAAPGDRVVLTARAARCVLLEDEAGTAAEGEVA